MSKQKPEASPSPTPSQTIAKKPRRFKSPDELETFLESLELDVNQIKKLLAKAKLEDTGGNDDLSAWFLGFDSETDETDLTDDNETDENETD